MRDTKGAIAVVLFLIGSGMGTAREARAQATPDGQTTGATRDEAIVIGVREQHIQLAPLKDANLAAILSIGTPGLGQFYVGEWQKGLGFLGGVAGSLVAVGLASDNLSLSVADYDDGDGIVQVSEYERWQDKPRRDFGDLSTARKAVVVGGFGVALGLYVWNVLDAHSSAQDYNRRTYAELTGIRVGLGAGPDGTMRGQVCFAF